MDCCSQLINNLPRAELRFFPAVSLGIVCSGLILLYLYSKKKKLSFFESVKDICYQWFVALPSLDHPEFMGCNNEGCAKCMKSEDVKKAMIKNWKDYAKKSDQSLKRIAKSISKVKYYTKKSTANQKPTIFKMDLPAYSWWTDFDVYQTERQLLKINMNIIQEEFESVFKRFELGKTDGWKLNNIPAGHWCIFPIIDQGKINETNAKRCPNTSSLINNLPSLLKDCVFGNACFSLIYPDSHIEPHYGPTNIRLRCHFGIKIPVDCYLEVDGTQKRWNVGESLVFDDSFEHHAYYGSKKTYANPRVILLIDFWHPGVKTCEKEALQYILPPME